MRSLVEPVRIGVLNDISDEQKTGPDIERWLSLAVEELREQGRINQPVEFVHACGRGLPNGTAAAVEQSFVRLVEEDVLMIVGPAIGDNALIATPLADRYKIPCINWAGTERARSAFMFHLQVGSHEDEPVVLARYLQERDCHRISIVYDESPIGQRYLSFFQSEAEVVGFDIVSVQSISPVATEADTQVATVLESRADAVLYLGLGYSALSLAKQLNSAGWEGVRAMNTAGIHGYQPGNEKLLEGWVYVDMFADDNAVLQELCQRQGLSGNQRLAAAKGYDLGRLMAEGIARATDLTRYGVRDGLEQIKWVPAAEGFKGTQLSFGNYNHGALHGRYLVLRQWSNGESLQV